MFLTTTSLGDPIARGLQTAEMQARRIRAHDGGPDHEAGEILAATLSLIADRTGSHDQARAIEHVLDRYGRRMPDQPDTAVSTLLHAYEGLTRQGDSRATAARQPRTGPLGSDLVKLVIAHAHLRAARMALREGAVDDAHAHIDLARRNHDATRQTSREPDHAVSEYLDAADLAIMLADEDGPDRVTGRLHAATAAIRDRIAQTFETA